MKMLAILITSVTILSPTKSFCSELPQSQKSVSETSDIYSSMIDGFVGFGGYDKSTLKQTVNRRLKKGCFAVNCP